MSSSTKRFKKEHPGYRNKYSYRITGIEFEPDGSRRVIVKATKKRRHHRRRLQA